MLNLFFGIKWHEIRAVRSCLDGKFCPQTSSRRSLEGLACTHLGFEKEEEEKDQEENQFVRRIHGSSHNQSRRRRRISPWLDPDFECAIEKEQKRRKERPDGQILVEKWG